MGRQQSTWQYIKGYKFNRLLLKNFIYVFVLVTLPLLLVLSLNYNKFDRVVNNRVVDMNEELLQKNADRAIRIPMGESQRSLNLSNSVAIVLYEALRQNNFLDLV